MFEIYLIDMVFFDLIMVLPCMFRYKTGPVAFLLKVKPCIVTCIEYLIYKVQRDIKTKKMGAKNFLRFERQKQPLKGVF